MNLISLSKNFFIIINFYDIIKYYNSYSIKNKHFKELEHDYFINQVKEKLNVLKNNIYVDKRNIFNK